MPKPKPILSLVICTHRRFELLKLAVDSLCKQTADSTLFEVIVVDNDKTPNKEVENTVKEAETQINIRYIFEPNLGLSNARNTGGKAALADYVGYMDDDAKAPEYYIEKALEIIKEIQPDIFGGPYKAFYTTQKPKWFKDEYGSDFRNNYQGFLKNNEFVNGSNMVFHIKVFDFAGWFDENLGMKENSYIYGEESMLQINAWKKKPDMKVWYDQKLVVEHWVNPLRFSIRNKFLRRFKMGETQAYFWADMSKIQQLRKKSIIKFSKGLIHFLFLGIPRMFFRNRKIYPHWKNYAYEKLYRYFLSFGQEWKYFKDFIK